MIETPVLIAGGGPVGLVLAHELEYRGVDAHLVERNPSTTRHPKMDVTNGRSMEHFRRLGIADEIRSHAVPSDHPMTVVWCTRFGEWELARFEYPSIDWGRDIIRTVNDGSLPLEPDMRISQVVLEPVLKDILERRAKYVGIRFGWALESFEQDADGVTSVIRNGDTGEVQTVRSRYLVGCDGAASVTRKQLGIELDDLMGEDDPTAGRMFMIHFRSQDRGFFERFGTAWHVQAPLDGTVISQNDLDTWTMHVPLAPEVDADAIDPAAFLRARLGADVPCEILVANAWKPRLVVAEKYGNGRVWLAGDSAHQVIPTGGYGMNTGVGDAVDIGWKLDALLAGWGGPLLLPAYGIERRHVGIRNRAASARHAAIRGQIAGAWSPEIHEDSARGEQARDELGALIRALATLENEAVGIEIGYRYDDSPIICHESGDPPAYEIDQSIPTSWPGVRTPSVYLDDGSALLDSLGRGFTLLRFADTDVEQLTRAAATHGVPFKVVDVRDAHARQIYERDLVLIRPDQHVAWRDHEAPADADAVMNRIRGADYS